MATLIGMDIDIAERLTGTLAADESGRPLVLHHGTFEEFTDFRKSRDIGFHFGTLAQATERRDAKARELKMKNPGQWRIMKVALAVHNVLVYPDDPGDWTNWSAIRGLSRHVDPEFLNRMRKEGVTESKAVARLLRDLLRERGYDAIAYRNMHENSLGSNASWSWLVLDSSAIISTDAVPGSLPDVGACPGLDLPTSLADIEGARGRNGNIRLQKDRKLLLDAVEDLACECGGELGAQKIAWDKPYSASYTLYLGDGLTGEVLLDIGRVKIEIPPSNAEAFTDIVDDFVAYVGLAAKTSQSLVYEWLPGETVMDFKERLHGAVLTAKTLADLQANQSSSFGSR